MKKVILISLDSLRVDVAYNGHYQSIERLRKEGTTFNEAVSSAPLTPVSHASMLSGLQPYNHGIRHLFREQVKDGVTTIAEIFKQNGYITCAIVSSPGMNKWYGFNKGFDVYDDYVPLLPDGSDPLQTVDVAKRGTAMKKGEDVIELAINWLNKTYHKDFFLFVHLFDSHWPYTPPEPFDKIYQANPYEGEVAYMDMCVGKILSRLTSYGILDETLVVCTSDHGEDLGGIYPNDHGGTRKGHPEEFGHGCLLYDCTQLVPLIFRYPPKLAQNKVIENQVRIIDVMPTILDLCNIHFEHSIDGISLVPLMQGKKRNLIGYSETHYPREQVETTGNLPYLHNLKAIRIHIGGMKFKIIWQINGDGIEFYDLKNDKNELHNLSLP